MAVLSNSGISSGSIVETTHVTQIIDAFTGAQEYDITLSGSLTITGSLNFDIISNNIQGTSSTSTTSSYSINSLTSTLARTSSQAQNETIIISFTHPPINLTGSLTYFIGGSNITTSGSFNPSLPNIPAGLTILGRYTLKNVRIAAISATTGSGGFVSGVAIGKNFDKAYDFTSNITYNNRVSMTRETNINLFLNPGDILTFIITPNNSGTPSTQTSHNIQLYLVSNA
jgi:hypothetical protein